MPPMQPIQEPPATDPASWVERHADALYRFALLRVADSHAAEELVQETFLAALANRQQFAGRSSDRTWLVGILKHKLIDHVRRQRHARDTEEEVSAGAVACDAFTPAGQWGAAEPGRGFAPERLLAREEFRRALRECLDVLPRRMATAFVLTEVDGMAGDQVCELMGVTPANYWALMSRARLHLRRCLSQKGAAGSI